MALRDVTGVLNGLRKVAAALCGETTSELQKSVSSGRSGLGPAASSLCKTAGEAGRNWSDYGELRWARRGCGGGSSGVLDTEYFPDWGEVDERLFPTTESFPGSLKHDSRPVPRVAPPQQLRVEEGVGEELPHSPPPPPPPPSPHPSLGQGRGREYHTLAPHLFHTPVVRGGSCQRWFHSSTRSGNETVVGGGSRSAGSVDSATPKPKQKVPPPAMHTVLNSLHLMYCHEIGEVFCVCTAYMAMHLLQFQCLS